MAAGERCERAGQLGVVWGRFGTGPNHDKGGTRSWLGSVYLLIRRRSAPVPKIYLWFPIRNQFYLFVLELEQISFVCSKAGTSKMRLHDAYLVRIKTNSLITHLLCVLGLCGPIRNLSILPHRALTVIRQSQL